jgi:hypothetical protein
MYGRLILILFLVLCGPPLYRWSFVAIMGGESELPAPAAVSADEFLNSLGVNTHADQGYDASAYVAPLRYLGIRNIRDGGRRRAGLIKLHRQTGIRVDLLGGDVANLTAAARLLAASGALLAIEGPNEPNNFPVTYKAQQGGGTDSWLPVAALQQDLYRAVKSDANLKRYPVFHVSEAGAETDNVGLQFLTIPAGASTLLPAGTQFADFANAHNYVSGHGNVYVDNQAWNAADPALNSRNWDGLRAEYGKTWRKGFAGYSDAELEALPRVSTETGWDSVTDPGGESVQGIVLVNTYLAQFKRGWTYTFVYELRDNEGGGGHQGLFRDDWTPKPAAEYIHNLTTVLAGASAVSGPDRFGYTIERQFATVHELLLQKSSSVFALVVWGERVRGAYEVRIKLQSAAKMVEVFDVTAGEQPIYTEHNVADISLNIGDHAMIIQIRNE